MILQALTAYYQTLERAEKIASPGWKKTDISFVLYIGDGGELERVISIRIPVPQGKKTVLRPQPMTLPVPADGRTSTAVRPNFLWDKSDYLLGISKGGTERGVKCFCGSKEYHETILANTSSPAITALLLFFKKWNPEKASEHPLLQEHMEDLLKGGNIVFRYSGKYIHEDAAVRDAWQTYYANQGDDVKMICLATGETAPIARIHPKIKGIVNGDTTGNSLVCFNDRADESYGCVKAQGRNAPTSKYAAFAYTTALNFLLADRVHTFPAGDATVVFWAQSGETAYQDFFGSAFGDLYEERDLRDMAQELCRGHKVEFDAAMLDPKMDFYILGLSPNAARLSVRFFLKNTFRGFLEHIQAHRERLRIVRPAYEKFEVPSLKALLDATVNQKGRDRQASPEMAGEMLRAILNDTPYPATLLNGVVLRIRAEHAVTWARAAILKAYYLKKPHKEIPEKEVLTVSLNEASTNIPYNLGRLFSVLEDIQQSANPGINATIKDKYFNSASATPAVLFPVLINLAQKHLKKLTEGQRVYFNKQLQAILDKLGENFPSRLNLPQQGAFQLGYYHQTQTRYQKKEEN